MAYLRHRLVTRIAQQAAAFGEGVRDVLGDSEKLLGMGSVEELKAAWARLCSAPPGTLRWRAQVGQMNGRGVLLGDGGEGSVGPSTLRHGAIVRACTASLQ